VARPCSQSWQSAPASAHRALESNHSSAIAQTHLWQTAAGGGRSVAACRGSPWSAGVIGSFGRWRWPAYVTWPSSSGGLGVEGDVLGRCGDLNCLVVCELNPDRGGACPQGVGLSWSDGEVAEVLLKLAALISRRVRAVDRLRAGVGSDHEAPVVECLVDDVLTVQMAMICARPPAGVRSDRRGREGRSRVNCYYRENY